MNYPRIFGLSLLVLLGGGTALAIEEAKFSVSLRDGDFEIRNYEPSLVAETRINGDFEGVGSEAFGVLFDYISGDNKSRQKVAMTSPVEQVATSEKIDMTSPVGQTQDDGKWAVSFTMPASSTMETLPVPNDSRVAIREIPARQMASVRYSGFWSEKGYLKNKAKLESWISSQGLTATGEPVWARYNAPFTPWFLRRNEVLIPVESGD